MKVNQNKENKQAGFTLVELAVSIGMIVILTGAIIQVSRFSDTHKSLTLATSELTVAIRSAQSAALSIPKGLTDDHTHICGFGVHITNEAIETDQKNYSVFYTFVDEADFQVNLNICQEDNTYHDFDDAGASNRQEINIYSLSDDLYFDDVTVGSGRSIFFIVPYGQVRNDGASLGGDVNFTIISTEDASMNRSVTINKTGKIN